VDVIPLLNSISDEAKEIGAVNTIFIERNNGITLHGYNTDVFGFEALLNQLPYKEPTLVLGSGGASKAVVYALKKQKTDFLVVSRNKKENTIYYQDIDAEILNKYKIIVNTTPLGMYPLIDKMPAIPMDLITEKHTLLDLIYNPGETLLMQKFKSRGAKTLNGMIMLQQQAEKAWKIFNSHTK
jgi:shikimate dehydrogenase